MQSTVRLSEPYHSRVGATGEYFVAPLGGRERHDVEYAG